MMLVAFVLCPPWCRGRAEQEQSLEGKSGSYGLVISSRGGVAEGSFHVILAIGVHPTVLCSTCACVWCTVPQRQEPCRLLPSEISGSPSLLTCTVHKNNLQGFNPIILITKAGLILIAFAST